MGQAMEVSNKGEQIERIANADFLNDLAAIMPYLLERREIARHITERGGVDGYEYLQQFNEKIKVVLNLF